MFHDAGKIIYQTVAGWQFVKASGYQPDKAILSIRAQEFVRIYGDTRVDVFFDFLDYGWGHGPESQVLEPGWCTFQINEPKDVNRVFQELLMVKLGKDGTYAKMEG